MSTDLQLSNPVPVTGPDKDYSWTDAELHVNQALIKVMAETLAVEKKKVQGLSYAIVSFVDVVNTLREAMINHNVTIKLVDSQIIRWDKTSRPPRGEGVHAVIQFSYRIAAGKYYYNANALGEVIEFADKTVLKCGTAALKQILMQTFMLGGDRSIDPDYENLAEALNTVANTSKPKAQPNR